MDAGVCELFQIQMGAVVSAEGWESDSRLGQGTKATQGAGDQAVVSEDTGGAHKTPAPICTEEEIQSMLVGCGVRHLVSGMVSHAEAQRNFWLHTRIWKTSEFMVWR